MTILAYTVKHAGFSSRIIFQDTSLVDTNGQKRLPLTGSVTLLQHLPLKLVTMRTVTSTWIKVVNFITTICHTTSVHTQLSPEKITSVSTEEINLAINDIISNNTTTKEQALADSNINSSTSYQIGTIDNK